MNFDTPTSSSPNPALQKFLEWQAVQLLLMGVFYVVRPFMERSFRRARRDAQREQAYRLREIIRKAELIIETHYNNADKYKRWAGDRAAPWRSRVARLGLGAHNSAWGRLVIYVMAARDAAVGSGQSIPVLAVNGSDSALIFAPP